jgi:hypothetical protein
VFGGALIGVQTHEIHVHGSPGTGGRGGRTVLVRVKVALPAKRHRKNVGQHVLSMSATAHT